MKQIINTVTTVLLNRLNAITIRSKYLRTFKRIPNLGSTINGIYLADDNPIYCPRSNVISYILPEWMVVSVSVLNWLLSLFLGLIQPSAPPLGSIRSQLGAGNMECGQLITLTNLACSFHYLTRAVWNTIRFEGSARLVA